MSLWQMPHASTFTRTCPAPGSGISRSTNSQSPPGLLICAAFIFIVIKCLDDLLSPGLPAEFIISPYRQPLNASHHTSVGFSSTACEVIRTPSFERGGPEHARVEQPSCSW